MPEPTASHAAFIDAIKAGEFDRVKTMVSADPTLLDARARTGESAILTAVYRGQKAIVDLRVSRGEASHTPDHVLPAELANHQKLVRALRPGHGADVDAADGGGWRPLHLAAANDNLDAMKALVAQGADVHSQNGDGRTPLSLAQEK